MSSSSLVVFTGRNRLRSTASAREPSKTSTAAPIADSIWMTGVLSGPGRVDRLAVDDDRQAEDAVALGQARGQRVEVDPQVVGVEPRVPVGVLEVVVLALGHHRAVAQHEAPVALAHAEVAALAVVAGAGADLGDVGDALARHPRRHRALAGGAEVVGVGQERVAVAALAQGVEQPGGLQRDVDVAVARRAPLQVGVVRPLHGAEVVGAQLGLLVLQEVQRQPVDREARGAARGSRATPPGCGTSPSAAAGSAPRAGGAAPAPDGR